METKIQRIGEPPTKEELARALNDRKIPVRFCYPNEGGDKWHELRRDRDYKLGEREITAFTNGLVQVKKSAGSSPINLIHLAPGDGIEIPILFEKFNSNSVYAGVDISESMIYNTVRLNETALSKRNCLWYLTDIEREGNLEGVCKKIKEKGANRNLILLTNQGVLFSNPETLKNVYNSMQRQDYIFITIEGDDPNRRGEVLSTYNLPEVRSLLSVGLQRAGYDPRKGDFSTSFNEVESRAKVHFKPRGEDPILCLASYKPRGEEFRKRLTKSGFDIQYFEFFEDIHSFAVLCKKEGE